MTLHHRLQTDYNFQDLGYGFLQKPSVPPTLNEYSSLKLDSEKSHKNFYLGCLYFIAQYLHKLQGIDVVPGPGCGIVIINPVSLQLQLVPGSTNFSSHTPFVFVCLTVFILFSWLCCINVNDINGKTDKQLCPRVLGLGLPQTNSSLFVPVALIYLRRQHWKSNSNNRYVWLEWKSGACAWWS